MESMGSSDWHVTELEKAASDYKEKRFRLKIGVMQKKNSVLGLNENSDASSSSSSRNISYCNQ
jgi:hypothetical protein